MTRPKVIVVFVGCFLISTLAAEAIEITPPSVGDTEVELTDYTVPVAIPGGNKEIYRDRGWITLIVLAKQSWGVSSTVYQVHAMMLAVMASVGAPLMQGNVIIAIDNWTGNYTYQMVNPMNKISVVEAPFEVEGFEAGATEMRITGLPIDGEVRSIYTTPGTWPSETMMKDGLWGDNDGEANGVIVTGVPRFSGPDYVLPGEVWTLMTEGDYPEPGDLILEAEGLLTRHVVSAVSHIIGASGVPFISDLSLSNPTGMQIAGWMRFVEDGGDIGSAPSVNFELGPGETMAWEDVLQSAFGINANVKGSLVTGGYPHWLLQVSSRNYAVDGDGNRFGIAIPGEPTLGPVWGANPWVMPGLQSGDGFRTNLIVAGMAPVTSQVTVSLVADGAIAGETVLEVPPYGLVQINRVGAALGGGSVNQGYLEIQVEEGGVAAAISVVDGSADDAAYISAGPMFPQ